MKTKIMALVIAVTALSANAQSLAPYPLRVDLQSSTIAPLTVFQANQFDIRATFQNGNTPETITTQSPFLWWYPYGTTNETIVTSSWTIVSGASGIVDFVLSPADLNFTTGVYAYQVGLDQSGGARVYKEGLLRIRAASGVVGAPIVFAATPVNWSLIAWTGLPDWIEDAIGAGIWTRQSNDWYDIAGQLALIDTKLDIAAHATSTGAIWSAIGGIVSADNALTNVTASGRISAVVSGGQAALSFDATGLATGVPLYSIDLTPYATGTPLYTFTELDPIWSSASNDYATVASLSAFATGSPLYEISFAGLATGTPLYVEQYTGSVGSVVGLATGTPLYEVSFAGLATGTPIYVEVGTGTLNAASIASFMPGLAISNTFYAASNPDDYIDTSTATNLFLKSTKDSGWNYIYGAVAVTGITEGSAARFHVSQSGSEASNSFRIVNRDVSDVSSLTLYSSTNKVFQMYADSAFDRRTLDVGWGLPSAPTTAYVFRAYGNAEVKTNLVVGGTITAGAYAGDIAGFTGTLNSAVSFPESIATTQYVGNVQTTLQASTLAVGAGATNLSLAIGLGATNHANSVGAAVGLSVTNLHLAQGVIITQNVNGIIAVGLVASNAYPTTGFATGVAALVNSTATTNISQQALLSNSRTNPVIVGTYTNANFFDSAFIAGPSSNLAIISRRYSVTTKSKASGGVDLYRHIQWSNAEGWMDVSGDEATTNRFLTTGTFSPSAYLTYSEYVAQLPVAETVTQNQVGVSGHIRYDSTNIMFALGGTNWFRVTGVLNPW